MKLKQIVGLSIIIFGTSSGLILLLGLVLVKPLAPTNFITDPDTGQQVAEGTENGSGNLTTPTPGVQTPTPAPATATPAPGAAATPVVTAKPGSPVTPRPVTPAPTAAPTPTPAPVYCGGKTPCYGVSAMAAHASIGNCWGRNLDWVINMTAYAPQHPNGPQNVESTIICGKDISGALKGTTDVAGTHNHLNSSKNNTASSQLASFRVGYYDASKP